MTTQQTIENKVSAVERYLDLLEAYKGRTADEIAGDATLRGAVERYLYLATQATLDLAEATIAYKDYRKPSTYRECFEILWDHGVIDRDLADRLVKMAAFRNLLAHDYGRIDYAAVVDILRNSLSDLRAFSAAIKRMI